jgi:spermidine/putrescine-binding protein
MGTEGNVGWPDRPQSRKAFLARSAGVALGGGALAELLAAGGANAVVRRSSRNIAGPGVTLDDVRRASGIVKVLGSVGYQTPANDPKGIKSQWGYNTSNEQIITKTTQKGTFDIVIIYQGEIDQLRTLNRIVPIDTSLIVNWKAMDPFFQNSAVIRRDGKVFEVPYHWGHSYIEYNSSKAAEPTSFNDLMSPDLQKKVIVPDDPYAVITTFAVFAGAKRPNNLSRAEFDQAIALLNKFKPQVLQVHQYGEEPQIFGRGDAWVGFPEFSRSVINAKKAGAPMKTSLLGAWSYVDGFMLLNGAKDVAQAYSYMSNSLSGPAQVASTKKSFALPVNNHAINALPTDLQYMSAGEVLAKAPLLPGVTIKTGGHDVPFQEWLTAWEKFKSA